MAYSLRSSIKKGQDLPLETEDLDDSFLEVAATPPIIGAELERTQEIDGGDEIWLCFLCKDDLYSSESIGCDGDCIRWFHVKCVDIDDDQFAALNKHCNSKWFCSTCRRPSSPGPLTQAIRAARATAETIASVSSDPPTNPEIPLYSHAPKYR